MKFQILINILTNRKIIPRIRGFIYGILTKNGSTKATIYYPLIFSRKNIKWGKGFWVYKNCRIETIKNYLGISFNPKIIFHDNISIQQNCHITCATKIEINSNTAIASNVTITDIDHPYTDIERPIEKQPIITMPVYIGKDCKIYNNAVILQGTSIGKHCVVGANSVVRGCFPDYSIIVGVPAKIIKRYNIITKRWERTYDNGEFITSIY